MAELSNSNLLLIDGAVWVLESPTGLAVYDFDYHRFLPCSHPRELPKRLLDEFTRVFSWLTLQKPLMETGSSSSVMMVRKADMPAPHR